MFKIKFPTKRIFRIFPTLRINGMALFCNLFYGTTLVLAYLLYVQLSQPMKTASFWIQFLSECLLVLDTDSLWWRHGDCSSAADCLFAVTWIHSQRLHWTAGHHLAFGRSPSLPLLPAVCQGLLHLPAAQLRGLFSVSYCLLSSMVAGAVSAIVDVLCHEKKAQISSS